MRRVRVRVAGRVQGVFFRVTCARRARELGLGGSVSNLADGCVQAVFEGDPSAVEAAVEWCRQGPPMAEVTLVEVVEESLEGSRGFEIVD